MKLCLAGIETNREHGEAVVAARAPNVLTSYFYARRCKRPSFYAALRGASLRLIDSGAFSIRTAVGVQLVGGRAQGAESAKGVDYDAYLAEYASWLLRMRAFKLADYWIELDIGLVTGAAWVVAQRNKLIAMGLGGGLVNVWHSEMPKSEWISLLREARRPGRSAYVAIEGRSMIRDFPLDYHWFLNEAYKRGVRVHCFRMTASADLRVWPFYSVDSTSWCASCMHGSYTTYTPTGVQQRTRNTGAGDRAWRGVIAKKNSTYKSRLAILIKSARAWVEAGEQADAMWLSKGVDWEHAIAHPALSPEVDVDGTEAAE